MKTLPKTLKGALSRLQRTGVGFYTRCADQFGENQPIHEAWMAMARDLEQQEESLKRMPSLFWRQLKEKERGIVQAIHAVLKASAAGSPRNGSLHRRFAEALDFEEPVTLEVCAPLIRLLRIGGNDHSLEFYILVKAHVARILRLVQPFSGDPSLIQRAQNLLEGFEREVQRPRVEVASPVRRKASPTKKQAVKAKAKSRARTKPASARPVRKRRKPLVKPVKMSRRRARR